MAWQFVSVSPKGSPRSVLRVVRLAKMNTFSACAKSTKYLQNHGDKRSQAETRVGRILGVGSPTLSCNEHGAGNLKAFRCCLVPQLSCVAISVCFVRYLPHHTFLKLCISLHNKQLCMKQHYTRNVSISSWTFRKKKKEKKLLHARSSADEVLGGNVGR